MGGKTVTWYVNPAISSWREFVNKKYPKRNKASDGTIGDTRHAASVSEHNPDKDGTVDAWDMDVNLLGSSDQDGNAAEDAAVEALKREFEKQPWAQLWIHNSKIANRDVGNWKVRPYSGPNKHDHHVHFQSRQSKERLIYTANFTESDSIVEAKPVINVKTPLTTPAWPEKAKTVYRSSTNAKFSKTVFLAQKQLRGRGWKITVDGYYGPATARIVKMYQQEKRLGADGILGPITWKSIFTAPITIDA